MDTKDWFVDYLNLPKPFTEEELYQQFKEYMEGNVHAREEIIVHNIGLVINEVAKFWNVPYEKKELVSVGMIGLIKGADTFDINRKIQFSTYVGKCIRNEILQFLKKNRKYIQSISFEDVLYQDKEGNELKVRDILCDERDLVTDCVNRSRDGVIREVIASLPERERIIINYYFGFENHDRMTQSEIANILGVSQALISRIIIRTLKDIKYILQKQDIIEGCSSQKTRKIHNIVSSN